MDILSVAWDVMSAFELSPYIGIIVLIAIGCAYFLAREYGKTWISHLLHRKNLPYVCGIFAFLCVFGIFAYTEVWYRFPIWVRGLQIILYGVYVVQVLRSVKSPVLFSAWYLKKYQKYLQEGRAREHRELIERKPWYLQDADEKVAYQILRARYLNEEGGVRASYEAFESIDQKLLYPEELCDLYYSQAVLLIGLGNLSKANQVIQKLENTNAPAYYALRSYIEEMQGNQEEAYRLACEGENAIPVHYKDYNTLISLYTQLGRIHCFRNNFTEMFRYYKEAILAAKKHKDLRLSHITYQNYLGQIQLRQMHKEEYEPLLAEYTSLIANTSLANALELENFKITTARQAGDREKEYQAIEEGYRRLHTAANVPDKYMVEISTLKMLNNGGFPVDLVIEDIKRHFNLYFQMPMPARINAIQDFTCPRDPTPEQAELFNQWVQKLVDYASGQALIDLEAYEKSLPTDCFNERCWALGQRVDLIRRSEAVYDGELVLRLMGDIVQIYERSGQLLKKIEAENNLLNEYDALIHFGQKTPDEATLNQMKDIVNTACRESQQIPDHVAGASLLDIAHFSAKLGLMEQAKETFYRFQRTQISPMQFSDRQQARYGLLFNTFGESVK